MSRPVTYLAGMYRSRARWRLGMAHTQTGGLSEVALLAHVGDQRWHDLGDVSGVPAAAQRDADGHAVYASFYFVGLDGFPDDGLGAFAPGDELEVVSTLERFGRSMLDGDHRLYRAGTLPPELPPVLPPAPRVRLSNVFVREGRGTDDLRITAPANARIEDVPAAAAEPDSYRAIREARQRGRFAEVPPQSSALWEGARTVSYAINADRDVNGVGLVYFANYVAFMDYAERRALAEVDGYGDEALDGRRTRWRQIGFYGNALRHDTLDVEVEAWALPPPGRRVLLHHRIRRQGDGRLIAVASAEKVLRA
jgi:probable biosynthetic protein (TIGR04098 family)